MTIKWHECGCQLAYVRRAGSAVRPIGFVITKRCDLHERERRYAVKDFMEWVRQYLSDVEKCVDCASIRSKMEGPARPVCNAPPIHRQRGRILMRRE